MNFVPKVEKGTNCRFVRIQNDYWVLCAIGTQKWIREQELAHLLGFSHDKMELICRRLANNGLILRQPLHVTPGWLLVGSKEAEEDIKKKKHHLARKIEGFFLRLTKEGADRVGVSSGKDVEIPKSWQHDMMSIQSLNFLREAKGITGKIITGAEIRQEFGEKGKLPDGKFSDSMLNFELERSIKSGNYLKIQVESVIDHARNGIASVVAYPYPPRHCRGVDHEVRQANAIRDRWGCGAAPIEFLRCHFQSVHAYENAKISSFELIELPPPTKTRAEKQRSGQKPVEKKRHYPHYYWRNTASREGGDVIEAQLLRDEVVVETISFRRGYADEWHVALDDSGITTTSKNPYDPYADRLEFHEFIEQHKESVLGGWRMCDLAPEQA